MNLKIYYKVFLGAFAVFSVFLLSIRSAEAAVIFKPPPSLGLIQGLVGYWSFDGTDMAQGTNNVVALDKSGQGNNGTLKNTATSSVRVPGKIGQALDFDGSDDFISTGYGASPIISSLTVSFWFKTAANNTTVKDAVGNADIPGNIDSLNAIFNGGGVLDRISCFIRDVDGDNLNIQDNTGNFYDNEWHHYVCVFAGTNGFLYLDGQQSASATNALVGDLDFDQNFYIGARNTGGSAGQYFDDLIDEVRIYNRALSSDEIKRLYRSGATLKINKTIETDSLSSGLVGHWTFDGTDMAAGGSGTQFALDKSSQGNTGTLVSGPAKVSGKIGQALDFDGTDDYVDIGAGPTSVNSIAFWVYPETATEFFVNVTGTTDYISSSAGTISATGFTSPTIYVDGVVSSTLVANRWQHIVVTTATAENASNLDIGRTQDTNNMEGVIDDVRIYNRVLSSDEIKRLYRIGSTFVINKSLTGPPDGVLLAGLAGYWSFNGPDVSGLIAFDRSGQGKNGTLTNGPIRSIGKIGQALNFDGSDDYVSAGSVSATTQSVSFWIKGNNTNQKILDLNGTANVEVVSGTITANGFTSPTIYVDGAVSSTITTGWHHVAITTGTAINASAVDIGRKSGGAGITVETTNTSQETGTATSHTVSLPTGISSGDLLIVHFGVDRNPTITWPGGWTEFYSRQVGGNTVKLAGAYKVSDGTEGATITVSTNQSRRSSHISYRISGHNSATAPEAATAQAAGSNPNPPSLAPSWGAEDTLWLAIGMNDDGTNAISAFPADYTNGIESRVNNVAGVTLGSAQRSLNASSEDPGTFTLSGGEWGAATAAVRPGAGGSGGNFSGLLDEVRIYNRALSADEVRKLYQLGF